MPCPYEHRSDRIAVMLAEACEVAAVPATPEMTQRFREAARKAQPFAYACGRHLAARPGVEIAEVRLQPEVAAAEALWRFMAGEAALLDSRIRAWLHVGRRPGWSDEALTFALEQLVYQMIGEAIVGDNSQLAA